MDIEPLSRTRFKYSPSPAKDDDVYLPKEITNSILEVAIHEASSSVQMNPLSTQDFFKNW